METKPCELLILCWSRCSFKILRQFLFSKIYFEEFHTAVSVLCLVFSESFSVRIFSKFSESSKANLSYCNCCLFFLQTTHAIELFVTRNLIGFWEHVFDWLTFDSKSCTFHLVGCSFHFITLFYFWLCISLYQNVKNINLWKLECLKKKKRITNIILNYHCNLMCCKYHFILSPKRGVIQIIFFSFLHENVYCEYSLEVLQFVCLLWTIFQSYYDSVWMWQQLNAHF